MLKILLIFIYQFKQMTFIVFINIKHLHFLNKNLYNLRILLKSKILYEKFLLINHNFIIVDDNNFQFPQMFLSSLQSNAYLLVVFMF